MASHDVLGVSSSTTKQPQHLHQTMAFDSHCVALQGVQSGPGGAGQGREEGKARKERPLQYISHDGRQQTREGAKGVLQAKNEQEKNKWQKRRGRNPPDIKKKAKRAIKERKLRQTLMWRRLLLLAPTHFRERPSTVTKTQQAPPSTSAERGKAKRSKAKQSKAKPSLD